MRRNLMPLIVPSQLPAAQILQEENIFVITNDRASTQDIRPLDILVVNLMPDKISTETQLARVLANSPLQVRLTLLHMGSHTSTHTDKAHLANFYSTIDDVEHKKYDGMVITGAPVEMFNFEEVDYWSELCQIMKYAQKNIFSTLYLCWGAMAGLYYKYGIPKYLLDEKLSGVYEHQVIDSKNPLVRGFDDLFYAPHSRHADIRIKDIEKVKNLHILAQSEQAGAHIIATENGRDIFVMGHMEYDRNTLKEEYFRDLQRGLNPHIPENYFKDNNPQKDVLYRWKSHANLLFSNWLNYYVYQSTPFDLETL